MRLDVGIPRSVWSLDCLLSLLIFDLIGSRLREKNMLLHRTALCWQGGT